MFKVMRLSRQFNSGLVSKYAACKELFETLLEATEYAELFARTHAKDCIVDPPKEVEKGRYRLFTSNYTLVEYYAVTEGQE